MSEGFTPARSKANRPLAYAGERVKSSHSLIVVWLDADVRNFGPHFVTRLVDPLLTDPRVGFVMTLVRMLAFRPQGLGHPAENRGLDAGRARPLHPHRFRGDDV